MTSGRLDEELTRMSAIASQLNPHCITSGVRHVMPES